MLRFCSPLALVLAALAAQPAAAQDLSKYSPEALESELAALADSRIAVMVPMRDGVRLSTNIYTPKNAKGRLPVILWKTPYNEHKLRGSTQRYAIEAVRRRPVAPQTMEWAYRGGLMAVLALMLLVTFNDLGNFGLWRHLAGLIG